MINYDAPHHSEDYVHRIGRTGRAGKIGRRADPRHAHRPEGDRRDREADRPQDRLAGRRSIAARRRGRSAGARAHAADAAAPIGAPNAPRRPRAASAPTGTPNAGPIRDATAPSVRRRSATPPIRNAPRRPRPPDRPIPLRAANVRGRNARPRPRQRLSACPRAAFRRPASAPRRWTLAPGRRGPGDRPRRPRARFPPPPGQGARPRDPRADRSERLDGPRSSRPTTRQSPSSPLSHSRRAAVAELTQPAGSTRAPYDLAAPFVFLFGFALASAARRAACRPSAAKRRSSSASSWAIGGKRQKDVGIGLPFAT